MHTTASSLVASSDRAIFLTNPHICSIRQSTKI